MRYSYTWFGAHSARTVYRVISVGRNKGGCVRPGPKTI
jgi:hypothetical protein